MSKGGKKIKNVRRDEDPECQVFRSPRLHDTGERKMSELSGSRSGVRLKPDGAMPDRHSIARKHGVWKEGEGGQLGLVLRLFEAFDTTQKLCDHVGAFYTLNDKLRHILTTMGKRTLTTQLR